jgi:hypothetical protein
MRVVMYSSDSSPRLRRLASARRELHSHRTRWRKDTSAQHGLFL